MLSHTMCSFSTSILIWPAHTKGRPRGHVRILYLTLFILLFLAKHFVVHIIRELRHLYFLYI